MKNNKKDTLKGVSDSLMIKELKQLIFKTLELQARDFKLRVFFGGMELQDEMKIYQYNIQDEFAIQYIVSRNEM